MVKTKIKNFCYNNINGRLTMMRFKRFLILIIICIPLFFIHGCVKKSDNVPMQELKEIITKTETNYTVVVTASELGVSKKATIKVDGPLNNANESSQWKYQIRQDGDISYFHVKNNMMIEIYSSNGQYIGKKSNLKDPTSVLDFNYFKAMLANNVELFSYDASKKIYTGILSEGETGKVTMRLSVSGGHLVYFDVSVAYNIKDGLFPRVGRMSFEFSDYGKTKVDLPTYTVDDETIYAEGAGQITNLTWKRIINHLPTVYYLEITGTDPFTNERVDRRFSFDNQDGDYRKRENNYYYQAIDNQPIYIRQLGSYWFGLSYDGELTDELADIVDKYLASYLEFNYNNDIGGYERYIDELKVEVQFKNNQISRIVLSTPKAKLEYKITYNNVRLSLPDYKFVDELPKMPYTKEEWLEICRTDIYSYQAYVNGPEINLMYYKINGTAFDDNSLELLGIYNYGVLHSFKDEKVFYLLEDEIYYRIELDDDNKFYAHKIDFAEIPTMDWYEEYITIISDYDHVHYDYINRCFIYEDDEKTIYIYGDYSRVIANLKIYENDQEYAVSFYRLNDVNISLPNYEYFRYFPPFSTNSQWNESINNLGDNYTLTCLDQNDEIISTTYLDMYNGANRIKIVSDDDTSYYTIIGDQYYTLSNRGDNWFFEPTTLNLEMIIKSQDIISLLDPDQFVFEVFKNYYEATFTQDNTNYYIRVRFTAQRLDWIWVEANGEVVQYVFSDFGITSIDYPNATDEEMWWHTAIAAYPKSYTLNYIDEIDPSQNALIKLSYSQNANNRFISIVDYQPATGDLQFYQRYYTQEGLTCIKQIKVGTSYYLTYCDGFDDSLFELIDPYRVLLDCNYDLFVYNEANNNYVALIDGITYTVQITNNYLSDLTVQTTDSVKHYIISDYGTTTFNLPDHSKFIGDFETKPSDEMLNELLNLDLATYYFYYSDCGHSGLFCIEPILNGDELIGHAYMFGIYAQTYSQYDYVVITNDEQYALHYDRGKYYKMTIDEVVDMNTHLEYLSSVVDIMQLFKDYPDLIVYRSSWDKYYLGVNNVLYTYQIIDDYRYITVESETNVIEMHFNMNKESFILPSTSERLTEDEFFRLAKDKPLNYDVAIDYQANGIQKQLIVSCAFEADNYGLIKIIDDNTTIYYDGEKMYELIEDELVEVTLDNDLISIIQSLEYKDTILYYYRGKYRSINFTPFGDYYSVTSPESLLEIGAVDITFTIADYQITSFIMSFGDNQIVLTFSNYGGVDLTQ